MEAPAIDKPKRRPPRFYKSMKKVSYGTRRNTPMLYHQYGRIYTTDEYGNVLSETNGSTVFKKRNTKESEKLSRRVAKGEMEYLAYYQQKQNRIVAWRDNEKLVLRVKGGLHDVNFEMTSQYEARRLFLQLAKAFGFSHFILKRDKSFIISVPNKWTRHKWSKEDTNAIEREGYIPK